MYCFILVFVNSFNGNLFSTLIFFLFNIFMESNCNILIIFFVPLLHPDIPHPSTHPTPYSLFLSFENNQMSKQKLPTFLKKEKEYQTHTKHRHIYTHIRQNIPPKPIICDQASTKIPFNSSCIGHLLLDMGLPTLKCGQDARISLDPI